MAQSAISPAVFSPAEAELASFLPDPGDDGFVPLGLFVITPGHQYTVVLVGLCPALDVDGWWSRG